MQIHIQQQRFFINTESPNQNHNKFLNQHKKTQVEKLIHSYQNNFVSAINSGDFLLVSSDILRAVRYVQFRNQL